MVGVDCFEANYIYLYTKCLYFSAVAHEVLLFWVVNYSVVLNDNIKLLLEVLHPIWVFLMWPFLFTKTESFLGFYLMPTCVAVTHWKPNYKSMLSAIGAVIWLCSLSGGQTVVVVTAILAEAGGKTVGCRLGDGWQNTVVLFTAFIKMTSCWTESFWNSDRLNLFYICSFCLRIGPELGWKSVCLHLTKTHFFLANKQSIFLPKPEQCLFACFLKTQWRQSFSLP